MDRLPGRHHHIGLSVQIDLALIAPGRKSSQVQGSIRFILAAVYCASIEPVRSSGVADKQVLQMTSFFANFAPLARSIASLTDHHSGEYALSLASSASLRAMSSGSAAPLCAVDLTVADARLAKGLPYLSQVASG